MRPEKSNLMISRGLHLYSEGSTRQCESRETEEALKLPNRHARTYSIKILKCVYANAGSIVSKEESKTRTNCWKREHFGTSDHQIVRWNIPIGKKKASEVSNTFYSFFYVYDIIRKTLTEIDLTRKTVDTNVEDSWEIIKLNSQKVCSIAKHGTKETIWITREVIRAKITK